MYLEISLTLITILFITSCYVMWNLNRKIELMEGWIITFTDRIIQTNKIVKEIDYKGYFEADDETGQIFDQLKQIINELMNFEGEK
tara:strand:+ start:658 stop:915 length:258 start_codon:yes stop_codon:yes gene_type:complete